MDNNLLKVLMTSIPGRYARALFSYAQQDNIVEKLSVDLETVKVFYKENPKLWRELSNKALTPQQLMILWQEISKKLHLHQVLINFILLLSQTRRLNFWPVLVHYYQLLNNAAQGKRQVMVRTPTPLSTKDQKQLSVALQRLWPAELLLTWVVSPPLKMGLVVESNNLRLDITLQAHLETLRQTLLETLTPPLVIPLRAGIQENSGSQIARFSKARPNGLTQENLTSGMTGGELS